MQFHTQEPRQYGASFEVLQSPAPVPARVRPESGKVLRQRPASSGEFPRSPTRVRRASCWVRLPGWVRHHLCGCAGPEGGLSSSGWSPPKSSTQVPPSTKVRRPSGHVLGGVRLGSGWFRRSLAALRPREPAPS